MEGADRISLDQHLYLAFREPNLTPLAELALVVRSFFLALPLISFMLIILVPALHQVERSDQHDPLDLRPHQRRRVLGRHERLRTVRLLPARLTWSRT